jgi:diketogulonate reductase-like aldo/keto reductase
MNIPTKSLKSGFTLPVYGLGTFMMGGRMEPDYSDDERYIAAIKAAIDHGIIHIDTAEVYGGGHCEELVGQAIKDYDRSKLIITSKLRSSTSGTQEDIFESCRQSLKRLGTDYLDLYLLHKYVQPGVPIENVMQGMNKLVKEGLVKNIGVSNMTVNRFEEAQKYSEVKLVCNQVHYSVQMREPEVRGLTEHARKNDYFIMAWGPLEKGLLDAGEMLQELAKKYNKTPYQIALNWVIAQPNVITIPKTTRIEHLEENLGALGWELEPEDLDRLTKDFPGQKTISDRVPLDYEADVAP